MKQKIKTLLATMVLLLCCGTMSAYVESGHDFVVDNIYYKIQNDKEVYISYNYNTGSTFYSDYAGDFVIPQTVIYDGVEYQVTGIGNNAFDRCSSLTSIDIHNNIKHIGHNAFTNCWHLASVNIPNSVTVMGANVFENCYELESVNIPNNLKIIQEATFKNCKKLTSIEIPNNVTKIADEVFFGSALESVAIPNSVTTIGDYAFAGCNLTTINIPNSITEIGKGAFNNCTQLRAVNINSIEAWCKIKFANNAANPLYNGNRLYLNGEEVTNLVIPGSITQIEKYAFLSCHSLQSVTIHNKLTEIDDYAFVNCLALKTVINFSGLSFIEGSTDYGYVAYYANMAINAPNGSKEGDYVFGVEDGKGVLCGYLGEAAELILPGNYKGGDYDIGYEAFKNCTSLTSVTIPNGVTRIGQCAFEGCSGLKTIDIPNGVTDIGSYAFSGCSGLKTIDIPNGVTDIGSYAFSGCSVLNSIVFPNSVTVINENAFSGCHELTSVHISSIEAWCKAKFINLKAHPFCSTEKWRNKDLILYGEEVTNLVIPETVTQIGDFAFYNCSGLISVSIPNSVTNIGLSAFLNCSNLNCVINFSELTFTNGDTNHGYVANYANRVINAPNGSLEGDYVFGIIENQYARYTLCGYIGNATDLILPENYKGENYIIGNEVFQNYSSLKSVIIPEAVTGIGNYAFYQCLGLSTITIPNSVTIIGIQAFNYCTNLKTVINFSQLSLERGKTEHGCLAYYASKVINAPNGSSEGDYVFGIIDNNNVLCGYIGNENELVLPENYKGEKYTKIGTDAFYKCKDLISISIPESITEIGDYAFYDCSGLTSFTIPQNVTLIGNDAFRDCSSLKTVINFSQLNTTKGSPNNGYVAYYADKVINAPNGSIEGDYIYGIFDDQNTLCAYLGDASELILPENYRGEDYVIGPNVFSNYKNLTSIIIPYSVTGIGKGAFWQCSNLKTVINFSDLSFSNGSEDYGYVAYYANKVINAPNGSYENGYVFGVIDGENALCGYAGDADELTLPESYNGENYVIGTNAFRWYTTLTSISIPSGVTKIGERAFDNCSSLTYISIPESITEISNDAFKGCEKLSCININSVEAWCKIKFGSIPFSNSLSPNKDLYINGEKVANLVIPEGVTQIGDYAFYYFRGLASITIPESVEYIGKYAFFSCSSLTSINIPNNLTQISDATFMHCKSLTSVTIPKSVTSIGSSAFYNCSGLTSVTIPKSVTSIGSSAFYNCSGLISISIPNSVTEIKDGAFEGCTRLSTVINMSPLNFTKGSTDYGYVAYYATQVLNNASEVDGYLFGTYDGRNFLGGYLGNESELILPENFNGERYEIANYAFYSRTNLTSIIIPEGVTGIGNYAFYGCENLKTVINFSTLNFKKGDSNNYGYVAYYADKVINAPNGSKEGDYVYGIFDGQNTLCAYIGDASELSLPENYNGEAYVIGQSVFLNYGNLTSITIPDSVIGIGNSAFYGCSGLNSVYINRLESWCQIQFENEYSNPLFPAESLYLNGEKVTHLVIPNSVTQVEKYAFCGWNDLNSVTIHKGVTQIGEDAFNYCNNLQSVYCHAKSAPSASKNVFLESCITNATLYIPKGTLQSYQTNNPWKNFGKIVESLSNKYIVTYFLDGIEFKKDSIEVGTVINTPEVPEKEGYTFNGWKNVPETMPAYDIVVTGSYSVNSYTVKYMLDGVEFKTETIAYGSKVTLPDAPEKEGHTFNGWENVPETMPANDVVVTGSYSVNSYTVKYVLDGVEFKTEAVTYGSKVPLPEVSEKKGHTFSGWKDVPETMPAKDIVVEGAYIANKYLLTFKIEDQVISSDSVEFGTRIEVPQAPEKEGHTFNGWEDVPETMPAKNVVVTGSYSVNNYTVTFMLDGIEFKSETVAYGSKVTLPEAPEKEGHTFNGWEDVPETMPAKDIVVNGSYTVNIYKVYYYVGDELVHTEEVAYGENIPTYEYTPTNGDKFLGWEGEQYDTMPAHDVTYIANIESGILYINGDMSDYQIYDLNGRKIENVKTLKSGVYIVNGKKTIVKVN